MKFSSVSKAKQPLPFFYGFRKTEKYRAQDKKGEKNHD
jgi:hypothetical protein